MGRIAAAALLAAALGLAAGAAATPTPGPGPGATGVPPGAVANASGSTGSETLDRTFGLSRLLDDPGVIRVQVRHDIPGSVVTLSTTVPENATVVGTEGFQQKADREYEWTREDHTPSITYRFPVNRTAEGSGFLFVDTGSWALVRRPRMPVTYSGAGERPAVVDTLAVDGTGAAGEDIAYLGEYRAHTQKRAGQRLRLVVPAAAALAERPQDVFDAVGQTAGRNLGPRDEAVFVVAAPTTVRWGATGLQRAEADLWVRDNERLNSPDSVWLHEYIHTRQVYGTKTETRWTVEGMADYYAALGTLEQGHIDYERFRQHLRLGRQYEDVVLADPDTWVGTRANYHKGTLVMAAIDRRIRLATDRERTLADVLTRVNREHDGDAGLTQAKFLDAVEAVAGSDVRAYARQYTETSTAPATWNRSEHMAAFGNADLRHSFDGVAVAGPYRNATYDDPPTLVPGERLTVRVHVENAGTAPGEYNVTLRAGGEVADTRSGTLDAGESTTLHYAVPVEAPDTVAIEVGDLRQTVEVRRPATPRVIDIAAPEEVAPGEPFRIDTTVANPAERPADGEVRISAGGERVTHRQVRLAPDQTAQVDATVTLEGSCKHAVAAGTREATVRVVEGRTPRMGPPTVTSGSVTDAKPGTPSKTGMTGDIQETRASTVTPTATSGPGLDGMAVLVALVLATSFLRGRGRR